MLSLEEAIYGIERFGMEITLATFTAYLCFNIFDDVQLAIKPVVFTHVFLDGLPTAKFTDHSHSVTRKQL